MTFETMTLDELYEKLASTEFRDPSKYGLFYNFFIYPYPVEREAEIRRRIAEFKDGLRRPVTYVDALSIDVFETFRDYLDHQQLGFGPSELKRLIDADRQTEDEEDHAAIQETLNTYARENAFLEFVHERIMRHLDAPSNGDPVIRPYVFVYGFTAMYPYLRANEFLSRYEQLNRATRYKLILFYPGELRDGENRYSLFGKLNEDHTYRAQLLTK